VGGNVCFVVVVGGGGGGALSIAVTVST